MTLTLFQGPTFVEKWKMCIFLVCQILFSCCMIDTYIRKIMHRMLCVTLVCSKLTACMFKIDTGVWFCKLNVSHPSILLLFVWPWHELILLSFQLVFLEVLQSVAFLFENHTMLIHAWCLWVVSHIVEVHFSSTLKPHYLCLFMHGVCRWFCTLLRYTFHWIFPTAGAD